ncbi:MAG: FecR domain-containing protein, partial [Luteimonas sp.]|nr:FecR domain-containing protein [Luteimonas sp.]
MKIYRTSPDENLHRVAREAAEWVQAMKHAPSREEREAFLAWVGASPLHLREALLADTVDTAITRPGALDGFDLDEVLARAADEGNVVALRPGLEATSSAVADGGTADVDPRSAPAMRRSRRTRSRGARRWGQVAALAAVFAVGLAAWQLGTDAPAAKQYASAIGEQRVIALADGSRVTLAPRSRISVAFSEGVRDIDLVSGEADFKVAHDRARPFRVHAGA